MYGMM